MRKVITNIKNILSKNIPTNFFNNIKSIKDSFSLSFLFKKKTVLIVISIFVLSAIIGLVIGLFNIKTVNVERENEKLVELYNKDRDLVRRGEAMSTENNTPMDRIPTRNK